MGTEFSQPGKTDEATRGSGSCCFRSGMRAGKDEWHSIKRVERLERETKQARLISTRGLPEVPS
jgi:hypothetical protein